MRTETTSYTPSSPLPHSPFAGSVGLGMGMQRRLSPVELEAPPGSRVWHGPDGVMYELAGDYDAGGSFGGATQTGGSGEVETKVDSEGRVWVRVPLVVGTGRGGSPTAGVVGRGGGLVGGGFEPVTPASTTGTGNRTVVVEPQELAGSVGRERDGFGERNGHEYEEVEWPRHQTYYHA